MDLLHEENELPDLYLPQFSLDTVNFQPVSGPLGS